MLRLAIAAIALCGRDFSAQAQSMAKQAGEDPGADRGGRNRGFHRPHVRPAPGQGARVSSSTSRTAAARATCSGIDSVARSPADGYTLLLGAGTITINHLVYKKLPYDVLRDLMPVTQMVSVPNVLVVHARSR